MGVTVEVKPSWCSLIVWVLNQQGNLLFKILRGLIEKHGPSIISVCLRFENNCDATLFSGFV